MKTDLNVQSIILIVLIAAAFIGAVICSVRHKNSCGCDGCSGCNGNCSSCGDKNKRK